MKEYSFQATTIFDQFATNFRIVKAILLIIMGCNVVVTDEEWVNEIGFIDIQPVGKSIEAWLLKAGCLPHPTNVSIETGKFLWKIDIFYRRTTQVVFTKKFLKYYWY